MRGVDKKSIAAVRLERSPIEPSWILAGAPQARRGELSRSRDGSAVTLVWDCTAGEFNWTYTDDETVHILEGEAIIEDKSGLRTIQPGDVVLFHAGSTCRWSVPNYVKKVAFLRVPVPRPAVRAIRAVRKLRAVLRGGGAKPALFCLAGWWLSELGGFDPAPLWS